MKSAAIVILLLSHDGYWFGGDEGTVQVQWAADVQVPEASFDWQLMFGETKLEDGRLALPGGEKTATLRLTLPEVRAATQMRLVYQVRSGAGAGEKRKVIGSGETTIHLFPNTLVTTLPQLVREKQVFVWDAADGLPALLDAAGVKHRRLADLNALAFSRPDILIVGPDQLDRDAQSGRLLQLASSGTGVLTLRQSQVKAVAGYPLISRKGIELAMRSNESAEDVFRWRPRHPLARHLRRLPELLAGDTLLAVRLPADEPALEVGYWEREVEAAAPAPRVPLDALVAVRALGQGRIVVCQVPLGDWQADPRSQLFLVDALDYLVGPVHPTLAPSQRRQTPGAKPMPPSSNVLNPFSGERQ